MTWSPTSLFNRRAYGSENLRSIPQKEFCNTIEVKADESGTLLDFGRPVTDIGDDQRYFRQTVP
jgi:hypothetical protein